jgi:TonB-dependent starch-binding outer membrane protein SusC
VNVLKDASSTAIYGSRGANGVILITTKKGRSQAPVVTYSTFAGLNIARGQYDMMDANEFYTFKKWARYYGSNAGTYTGIDDPKITEIGEMWGGDADHKAAYDSGYNTNWQDLMYKTGRTIHHQLGLTGGNDKTVYAISAGYYGEQGNFELYKFKRYNFKVSVEQNIGSHFKLGISTLNAYTITEGMDAAAQEQILQASPINTPYKPDGTLWGYLPGGNQRVYNPLHDLKDGKVIDELRRFTSFTTGFLEIDFTHGFKYKVNAGFQVNPENRGKFYARGTTKQMESPSYSLNENTHNYNYTVENIVTYDKSFGGAHDLNITGLYSIQEGRYQRLKLEADDILADYIAYYNPTFSNQPIRSNDNYFEKTTILSYMARVNYAYNEKYLLTLTVRADGASRLAPGNKWNVFPSAALAWNVAREGFLSDNNIFSDLKVRASYGTVGNSGTGAYSTLGGLRVRKYNFGSSNVNTAYLSELPNPALEWEKTSSLNVGLDFGLLGNRITGAVEYYHQFTSNLLLNQNLPPTSGAEDPIKTNVGKTENEGMEITISTINAAGDGRNSFSWTTDFNIFFNRNKITALSTGVTRDIGNGWFVGEPMGTIYDFKRIGIWQNTAADSALAQSYGLQTTGTSSVIGTVRVADLAPAFDAEGNEILKFNDDDKTIIGNRQADFEGGITNRIAYKNFDFSFVAAFRVGGLLYSDMYGGWANTYQAAYNNINIDYWTEQNPTSRWPKPNSQQQNPAYKSTLSYFDASYLKIRMITLGYTLPTSMLERVKIKTARVYTTASNPFVFFSEYVDKYNGVDPESAGNMGIYPAAPWSLVFGLNLSF